MFLGTVLVQEIVLYRVSRLRMKIMKRTIKSAEKTYGQEPWEFREVASAYGRTRTKSLCIFDADQNVVCTIRVKKAQEEFSKIDIANAERIVSCVNWCRQ
jgi:hypothetical protein